MAGANAYVDWNDNAVRKLVNCVRIVDMATRALEEGGFFLRPAQVNCLSDS